MYETEVRLGQFLVCLKGQEHRKPLNVRIVAVQMATEHNNINMCQKKVAQQGVCWWPSGRSAGL